jgi:L-arabinose transport system permease protein
VTRETLQDTPANALPLLRASRAQSLLGFWDAAGMLVLYVVLLVACSLFIRNFFSASNLSALAQSITSVGIVSCGMLFCLASGDFDLSVGSVAAVSGIVAVMTINATGSVVVGMAAGLAAGTFVGTVNGFVIARLRVNALITTLATMQIVRGLGYMISHHAAIGSLSPAFNRLFGRYTLLSIPTPVWLMAGCFLLFGILLHKTVFGRNTLAIGGNPEAARLAGINIVGTKIAIFALQGCVAALAGTVDASTLNIADPKASVGLELNVISACVLGGVSLTGGVGTILAAIVGTLIMGTVQNAMYAKNIDSDYQYLVSGGILLAAALYDQLKQRLTGTG